MTFHGASAKQSNVRVEEFVCVFLYIHKEQHVRSCPTHKALLCAASKSRHVQPREYEMYLHCLHLHATCCILSVVYLFMYY